MGEMPCGQEDDDKYVQGSHAPTQLNAIHSWRINAYPEATLERL